MTSYRPGFQTPAASICRHREMRSLAAEINETMGTVPLSILPNAMREGFDMQPAVQMNRTWVEVGVVEDIPRLGSRVVETEDGPIAVFRNAEDEVFALLNRCPHKGGPLSEGIVYGRTVACPLHNWCLDLANGQARAPDEGCTPSFPVRLEDGRVFVSLEPDGDC